jgi:hypothetical protein
MTTPQDNQFVVGQLIRITAKVARYLAIEHNAKLMSDDSKFPLYLELEGRLL